MMPLLPTFPTRSETRLFPKPVSKPMVTGEGLRSNAGAYGSALSLAAEQETMERRTEDAQVSVRHPFQVTKASGDNIYQVLAGTCDGQAIETQTIDVEGTRPVAILVYPKYTLGIDGGEFVRTLVVKTGANKPKLVKSTTILDDVDSGITSEGTEARALVAIIRDSGIEQYAYGNIRFDWDDDSSLTGVATGGFNKNV